MILRKQNNIYCTNLHIEHIHTHRELVLHIHTTCIHTRIMYTYTQRYSTYTHRTLS